MLHSLSGIKKRVYELNEKTIVEIKRSSLNGDSGWFYDAEEGEIRNQ